MAGKRRATTELQQGQDDEQEEREDPGIFQRASEDSLKKRVIKTARRRNPISSVNDSEDSTNKSAFTGLNMFGKAPPTSNAFSFLSNLNTSNSQPKTNGIYKLDNIKGTDNVSFGNNSMVNSSKSIEKKLPNDYYSKLKGLNESVAKWIKEHVDDNPLINLKPIFTDYEQYFNELESEKHDVSGNKVEEGRAPSSMVGFKFKSSENIPDSTTEKANASKVIPKFSFNSVTVSKAVEPPTTTSTISSIPQNTPLFPFGSSTTTTSTTSRSFSFGAKNTISTVNASSGPAISSMTFGSTNPVTTSADAKSTFSIGSTTTSDSVPKTTSTFSFGASNVPSFSSSSPFTFANVSKPASEAPKNDAEDDYEPPKNEFTPVTEADHIYTVRCKVFVKKDEKFGDRGVGNLYLKPIEDREQVQLIVRADTSIGNLLCNFILSKSIPTKRIGNKDVMLVCLPTPDFNPPPVPVLLRVKSGEEADQLLEVLDKHKK
ncbi:unnamed protein product [Phaedon cochleariae]|uniref:RanBD1 domain-containing protein n=1 Tax=Phaedon cochleariae TaxID=80249 RepID=A0A9N9SH88_PHACE|nr:unnamed protein product [Phaedon cochleariae]